MKNKAKTYQTIVFILGVCLISVSFVEYRYEGFLSNLVKYYEDRIEESKKYRKDLVDITLKSSAISMDYFSLDFNCYVSTTNGYFNHTEAIIFLMANAVHFNEPFEDLEDNFLLNLDDSELDINWIFTEKMITLQWLAEDFSSILPKFESKYHIDNFEQWSTVVYTTSADFFFYAGSYSILKDWLGNMPFLIVVDFWKFDAYVKDHYEVPLGIAESNVAQLNAMISLTTLGLLIIGFIVDAEKVSIIWKILYYIFAIGAIALAIYSSILIFVGGG